MLKFAEDAKVKTRCGKETGTVTGGGYLCRMEGCGGWRVGVRWPNGAITFPCSKGMDLAYSPGGEVLKGRIL